MVCDVRTARNSPDYWLLTWHIVDEREMFVNDDYPQFSFYSLKLFTVKPNTPLRMLVRPGNSSQVFYLKTRKFSIFVIRMVHDPKMQP